MTSLGINHDELWVCYVCIFYVCVYTHVCLYVCLYIYTHTYAYVYTYMYIHSSNLGDLCKHQQ